MQLQQSPRRARFTTAKPATAKRVPEWRIQAACVAALRKTGWNLALAGDMNAARRSVAGHHVAVVTGMAPGEPDLRVYGPHGRLLLIEYKAKGGRLSSAQKDRHAELLALGHPVTVIQADNEHDAITATLELVKAWLAKGLN